MNLMSSIAKMLSGLAIATVSTRPSRLMGTTWNFWATSGGMSSTECSSGSISSSSTEATWYVCERNSENAFSDIAPVLTRLYPRLPPVFVCSDRAISSCSWLMRADSTS